MAKELADLSVDEIVSLSEMEVDLVNGARGLLEFSARAAREYSH